MWEWFISPVDPTRIHDVGWHLSVHARVMVVAWGVLVPCGVIAARFFKVLPWQDYPNKVDSRVWWNFHRAAQYSAIILMSVGLWMILNAPRIEGLTSTVWLHRGLGWTTLVLGISQMLSGIFRGTKGGPKDKRGSVRGDHYDMTRRRLIFEVFHKTSGYVALGFGFFTITTGLWQANAPRWMWIVLAAWWISLSLVAFVLQRRGMVIATYAAIWGPDQIHPGNTPRDVSRRF